MKGTKTIYLLTDIFKVTSCSVHNSVICIYSMNTYIMDIKYVHGIYPWYVHVKSYIFNTGIGNSSHELIVQAACVAKQGHL